MDDNKAEKLREIGYEIRNTCGSCKYGQFREGVFGLCSENTYAHKKHTGEERFLSVIRYGHCSGYEQSDNNRLQTEHFLF